MEASGCMPLPNDYSESDSEYGDYDDCYGEPQYEAESFTNIVGESRHEVDFRLFKIKEKEFEKWLETIQVSCTVKGKEIGSAMGRLIHRERIKPIFWESMEEPNHYMSNLAFKMFDRYGRLKKSLKEHPVQRGTGAWGDELDSGPLFFIEHIEVSRDWRRMGLGRKMIHSLIRKATEAELYPLVHHVVTPGWFASDVESEVMVKSVREQREIKLRAVDSAVAFYRSLGFRRVGASNCLALSLDPKHKSRAIAKADDFDPPTEPLETDTEGDDEPGISITYQELLARRLLKLKEKLPLHHATLTMSDAECVEFYKAFDANDGSEWTSVNHRNETLLHVAACQLKLESVKWLVEKSGRGETLVLARNISGYTPLEALQDQLETSRTQADCMGIRVNVSDEFTGFPPVAISCMSTLLGWNHKSLTNIQFLRLKYGCTCGNCLGGFLSPRMKSLLVDNAELIHDELCDSLHNASERVFDIHRYAPYANRQFQQAFMEDVSIWEGYIDIFSYVASCLGTDDKIPTCENIISELPPDANMKYIQLNGSRRGKLEPVLQSLLDETRTKSLSGSDGFQDEELSKCRNDDEFGVVALACGLSSSRILPE